MINLLKIFARENKANPEKNLLKKIKQIYRIIPIDFGGGCSLKKGIVMARLIQEFKISNTADIGVYRGRSLFPQAFAHKFYHKGIVYGIDPYTKFDAVQSDAKEIEDSLTHFLNITDFEKIYNKVIKMINNQSLNDNCKIIRKKSNDAIDYFNTKKIKFGLIHIDGNHDTRFVMQDVINYVPLLIEKSFIVMDDISWDSVKPAVKELEKTMTLVGSLVNDENDFALYAKGLDEEEMKLCVTFFNENNF